MAFEFERLRDQLVCPKSHASLVHDGDTLVCADPESRLAYPIVDEIPIMLIDEARELTPEEWSAVMARHGRHPETGQPTASESA